MILDRDQQLAALVSHLADLDTSGGKVVLVRGEAGIGKSALISEFIARSEDHVHVLLGTCDDLLTPQPLGPFWDVGRNEATVGEPLRRGERRAVLEALLDLLARGLRPTVLVIEDVQWADEATLDAIKFLGRRIARTNGLLVLSYRDGEVDTEHPLRTVIGELPPQNMVRVHLDRLSSAAVDSMVAGTDLDADEVFVLTGGNPLFVTEVIAAGVDEVPASIKDSVLGRASKLSLDARRILDLVAVCPGEAERSLVAQILDLEEKHVDEAERHGLLRVGASALSFPHEVQRRALESSLAPAERRRLNREILGALPGDTDPSRLVHHAQEAEDVEAIIRFGPDAARAATAIESHREALAHFRTLEPHLDLVDEEERAGLLDDWAREEYFMENVRSLEIVTRAIDLRRTGGDPRALARSMAFGVRVAENNGHPELADVFSVEAVEILEPLGPSADLAFALSQQAWLRLMRGDDNQSGVDLADRAIEVAEKVGDERTVITALTTKGGILHSSTDRDAFLMVEEAHRRAAHGGYRFEEVYALVNLAGLAADVREIERAADLAQRARETAVRYEIRPMETYSQAMYSEILVWKGDWAAAEDAATEVLGGHSHAEGVALRMLGILQARLGRPEARETLDQAWDLAQASAELQATDPAGSALAEYLWLSGEEDPDAVSGLEDVLERGVRSGFVWPSGALAFWAWKLGILETVPDTLSESYRLIIEGDWRSAADFWEARGAPYEQGLALMHGDGAAQLEALRIFEDLGARATAGRLRGDLLAAGVKVPRGRSRAARDHGAGLTSRQAEVLELLAERLSNTEIADRLFISYRTVENHVAAILMKLDVPTRAAAIMAADERGLLASR